MNFTDSQIKIRFKDTSMSLSLNCLAIDVENIEAKQNCLL